MTFTIEPAMIKYPLVNRIAYALAGYPLQRTLNLLEQSQWWPRERLEALRDGKLAAMVEHCYGHVPYYRRVMDERRLTPADITTATDLPKLPVLTKDLVRAHWADLQADNVPDRRCAIRKTGGTTGEPMRIRMNKHDGACERACYTRAMSWGGLLPTMPRAQLSGGSLGQKRATSLRDAAAKRLHPPTVFLPAFELSARNVGRYVEKIKATGCRHLTGYASALYRLAVLAEEAGASLQLEAVFSTAEVLPDAWRDKIQAVFGCKVLPYYGCGEVNSLGYSCGQGAGLHRCDEHVVMEVQADGDGQAASLAGEGAFLISDLDQHGMPILRYRNGDAGVLSDAPCACGRSLGRIARLDGRTFDMLVTAGGEMISGVIGTVIFHFIEGVTFWQFVQDRPGQALVRLVVSKAFDRASAEARIRGMMRDHLGESAEVDFEYPADIERTPAGKARFVINRHLNPTP